MIITTKDLADAIQRRHERTMAEVETLGAQLRDVVVEEAFPPADGERRLISLAERNTELEKRNMELEAENLTMASKLERIREVAALALATLDHARRDQTNPYYRPPPT